MALKIRVYSDYVCPYCFLAEGPLEETLRGKDVEIEWMPFELRPAPNPTLKPEEDYLQSTWKQSVYPIADRMGVKIVLPKVSPQPYTHLAFEGFQFAKEHGKANEYNHRMFTAFFQEEKDIGDIEVLAGLAGEIGLNQADFKKALETRKYKEKHQAALEHAYNEANINSVPTLFIGDQVLRGLYSTEMLEKVIKKQLEAQQAAFPEGMSCDVNGNC